MGRWIWAHYKGMGIQGMQDPKIFQVASTGKLRDQGKEDRAI